MKLRERLEVRIKTGLVNISEPDYDPQRIIDGVYSTIVELVGRLIPQSEQAAVLDRERLAARWFFTPFDEVDPKEGYILAKIALAERAVNEEKGISPWPIDVSDKHLADALEATGQQSAVPLIEALRKGWFYRSETGRVGSLSEAHSPVVNEHGLRSVSPELAESMALWPLLSCSLVLSVLADVRDDLKKEAMALDAGNTHHTLISEMRNFEKDRMRNTGKMSLTADTDGRIELISPGKHAVQLSLLEGEGLSEVLVATLREWHGPEGLRHWAAMQSLLSIPGGRSGRVKWRLEEHLDALGYSQSYRKRPEVRRKAGRQVELYTLLELAIYDHSDKLRIRQALLNPLQKFDIENAPGIWAMEGMEFDIHPGIYSGVRKPNGELGTDWFPQTPAVAKIDHKSFRGAIELGMILPIRWRWDWKKKHGRDYVTLSGQSLLLTAGIPVKPRRPLEAWGSLKRALDELKRIEALGEYHWDDPKTAWTSVGLCILEPPAWAKDRTHHGLNPVERPRILTPATSEEFKLWRKHEGLTQEQAAARLGVSRQTIYTAETSGKIGKRLKTALSASAKM